MTVLLFVHGTSVREPGHDRTLAIITEQVRSLGRDWVVETCYWGTVFGASLSAEGASIPGYQKTRGETVRKDRHLALWSVLYADPYYELRVLKLKPSPPPPFGASRSQELVREMEMFSPSTDAVTLFSSLGLEEFLQTAVTSISASSELRDAAATAEQDDVEHRQAIARAIVADTLTRARTAGEPAPSAWMRDKLVDTLATDLRANVLGLPNWLSKTVGDLVTRVMTPALLARRVSMTDVTTPALGDILRFLARPRPIQAYLSARISAIRDPDVYLLGHSLGGIICVDLLARSTLENVRGLITVGSQAPYLHEIGALPSLPADAPLPAAMPPWLNIYDAHDMLSYVGADLYGDKISDVMVKSGQPFPQAHSAYWHTPAVWEAIIDFVDREP